MPQWSFVYQYAVGGAVFVAGMVALVRAGAIRLDRRSGRRAVGLLVGGFVLYALAHALSVFVLPGA
jgi:hypothetical protein